MENECRRVNSAYAYCSFSAFADEVVQTALVSLDFHSTLLGHFTYCTEKTNDLHNKCAFR